MDLKNQFRDLDLNEENLPEKTEDFDESDKIVKDLEKRLSEIRKTERPQVVQPVQIAEAGIVAEDDNEEEVVYEDVEQEPTFYEKVQPFILPIALTFFAIVFAGMFLYFFSKSRVENTAQAIINQGVPEPVYNQPAPVPVVVKEEPLTCVEPQILNETKDACIDPEPEVQPEPEPTKPAFKNGMTFEVNVRFSYDKFNYDNTPRGIYLLQDQLFDGEYKDFKLNPTNRSYANDYFFGVDRYTVSLIGSCSYVIKDAKILVEDMNEKDGYFTGKVAKVIEATKPMVDCAK